MRCIPVLGAVLLCGLGVVGAALLNLGRQDDGDGAVKEIVGPDLEGAELRLSDFRGQVVLLQFWGDDGTDWRRLHAYEKRLQKKFANQPFTVVGVSLDATPMAAQLSAVQHGFDWPCWYDGVFGPIATEWQVGAVPTFFLIDHDGRVRERYEGALVEEDVEAAVAQLLIEAHGPRR